MAVPKIPARRIGILSDSHGNAKSTRQAVKSLKDAGAELFLHLGDIGGQQVLEELIGIAARIVFGNCDMDQLELTSYAKILGIAVDHPMGVISVGGRRVAYTHGHFSDLMERALKDEADYLLHGHTHELRDDRIGSTRVINPGALSRAARYTAAVLDPAADRLEIIEIPKS